MPVCALDLVRTTRHLVFRSKLHWNLPHLSMSDIWMKPSWYLWPIFLSNRVILDLFVGPLILAQEFSYSLFNMSYSSFVGAVIKFPICDENVFLPRDTRRCRKQHKCFIPWSFTAFIKGFPWSVSTTLMNSGISYPKTLW